MGPLGAFAGVTCITAPGRLFWDKMDMEEGLVIVLSTSWRFMKTRLGLWALAAGAIIFLWLWPASGFAQGAGGYYDYKKTQETTKAAPPQSSVLPEEVRSRIDKVVAQNLWNRRAWREEIERALLKAETKDQEFAVLSYFEQAVVREWSRRHRVYEGRVIVEDPTLGWLRCYDLCYKVCRETQDQRVCAESCGRACDRSYPPR